MTHAQQIACFVAKLRIGGTEIAQFVEREFPKSSPRGVQVIGHLRDGKAQRVGDGRITYDALWLEVVAAEHLKDDGSATGRHLLLQTRHRAGEQRPHKLLTERRLEPGIGGVTVGRMYRLLE